MEQRIKQHWTVQKDFLEIDKMPFYWRLTADGRPFAGIPQKLPIRVARDSDFDYLRCQPTDVEWQALELAYRQNATIGFINDESGHLDTYGASANSFFLKNIQTRKPERIYEIGCGAGFSIRFLRDKGWRVVGVDPSEYSSVWSEKLGFELINDFFSPDLLAENAQFIFCNDVFEHVPHVKRFAKEVFDSLSENGTFAIVTTNSSDSIQLGDISMLEHQHVNMFTEKSIYQILSDAGFSNITIESGSYGSTFQITAEKKKKAEAPLELNSLEDSTTFFLERACSRIRAFEKLYKSAGILKCYVPLRCIPYLATVADYGDTQIFDSNSSWAGKFIDGYSNPIRNLEGYTASVGHQFFVGSLTFCKQITKTLISSGVPDENIHSVKSIV